ncbi:MAG TPA: hypothetical protein VFG04_28595 [Planctomycetaceae bacterium]|nr:hypothetical protein [Planctomycetaceae bacterium]
MSTRRMLKAVLFGCLCVGSGMLATNLLPHSSILMHAAVAGAVSGLVAAVLMRVPWMRSN